MRWEKARLKRGTDVNFKLSSASRTSSVLRVPTMPAQPAYRELFIDGKWQAPTYGGRIPVISPSMEEEIGTII